MSITAYGRSRSDLGELHLSDGQPGYWSACGKSAVRAVSHDAAHVVTCKACRKVAERITVLKRLAEANGGTFSVKADGMIRGLMERGTIERVSPAGRGGWHAAIYRFKAN